ncbi:hypothetical protein DYBT9623_04442 [Dyadobacter sp. CECT 9623]|uniref:Uncharacterized protein n=1 Tax=Dyadobacter linearis TaxID=2823330 RepID=A0ABM8UW19_9BACT|nr:hypothetical protein [Dyadobacter sp. CECT 9623]CAG5072905.1 hypothetical protein DYBT9623_04442 [Dyadobacter sp. CECT 9623]
MSELVKTEEVTGVAVSRPMGQVFDLTGSIVDLPILSEATEMPLDLMSDYWTPENAGEFKNVFFDRIDVSQVLTQDETPVLIDLECAYFLEQDDKREIKSVRNGSKRLVGALLAQNVQRGTALKITYMGKKKNRSNAFKSDNWSVKPLIINI